MKPFHLLFALVLTCGLFLHPILGCSVDIIPLRKQFRRADAVFTGRVKKVSDYYPSAFDLQRAPKDLADWKFWSKVTFEIDQKWKGNMRKNEEFLAAIDVCTCDVRARELKEGVEYLVFAEKRKFLHVCRAHETDNEWAESDMKKLNKFSFRLWSRLYPF